MATPRYVIGVDIGTTGTKSILFNFAGNVISKSLIEYPLYSPTPDTAEQDPDEILQAVLKTVGQVMKQSEAQPEEILCLCFSCAMHSLIALAADNTLLTRSITWADNRAAAWADIVKQKYQGHEIYLRTGTPIHPMSPLVKLAWLRHDEPELFQKAAKFISLKEYIFHHLFQRFVVDHSIASATGLLNLFTLQWDEEALAVAGIRAAQLSELVSTTQVLQPMSPDLARIMGILPETPVVAGASDGVLSNLGVGAMSPAIVATTIGTSGAIRAVLNRPVTDPQARLFCYALTEQHWVVGGAVNNGGIAMRWVRDQFADAESIVAKRLGKDPYELLMLLAETVPPGASGLIFHPYLLGERSPLWDANARGSFFGLTLNHTKAHLIRAVMEGILFNLLLVLQALQDFTGATQQIQATGGFARSALWRQMMADIFNQPITIPQQHESSCLGAAVLGLYAFKQINTLSATPKMIGETHEHQPIPANAEVYQKILPIYAHLLKQFQANYATITKLQTDLSPAD